MPSFMHITVDSD